MTAFQESEKMTFGTGRLFVTPAGSSVRQIYANLNDVSVDFKIDQKAIFGEGGFPIAVADGHREIDIMAKHYTLALGPLANDLGLAAPVASTDGYIVDEVVTVTSHAATLAHTPVAGTLDLVMDEANSPVRFVQVTGGSEAAGVSYSISGATVTFASGETATTGKASYAYANSNGNQIILVNSFQNSSASYSMDLVKRDRSVVDNSIGFLIMHFNAVRPGAIKMPYKEGDWSNYERSFKAFADPFGNVGTITFVNE